MPLAGLFLLCGERGIIVMNPLWGRIKPKTAMLRIQHFHFSTIAQTSFGSFSNKNAPCGAVFGLRRERDYCHDPFVGEDQTKNSNAAHPAFSFFDHRSNFVWLSLKQKCPLRGCFWFAEREGFEPSIPF
jgi:hypothetical protein